MPVVHSTGNDMDRAQQWGPNALGVDQIAQIGHRAEARHAATDAGMTGVNSHGLQSFRTKHSHGSIMHRLFAGNSALGHTDTPAVHVNCGT